MNFPLTQTPIRVADEVLADLRVRLESIRWPLDAGNEDEFYGVSARRLRGLVEYWLDAYDWRRAEAEINRFEHYQVQLDGVPIHFMRRASSVPGAIPLVLTHGWPWTFWHWSRVMDPLARGATGEPAFDVIAPCVPRLRVLDAAAGTPRHDVRQGRGPLAHADAGRAGS